MRAVRRVRKSGYSDTGLPGFQAQFVAVAEMAAVVVGRIASGACGPALHLHPVDQYYYMLSGTMTIRLGSNVERAGPGSLICIPAGLPHCNWNDEPETEVHLELLAPMVRPGQTHFQFVDSVDDAPPIEPVGYVTPAADATSTQSLTRPDTTRLQIARTDCPAGTLVHDGQIIDTDRMLFVTVGELLVEMGGETPASAAAPSLVVVPALVPHRVGSGASATQFLDILAPASDASAPRRRPVEVRATGPWAAGWPAS